MTSVTPPSETWVYFTNIDLFWKTCAVQTVFQLSERRFLIGCIKNPRDIAAVYSGSAIKKATATEVKSGIVSKKGWGGAG